MKLDNEYLKKLLLAVEMTTSSRPFLQDVISQLGVEIDDMFVLHYEVLFDYGFLESLTNNGSNGIDQIRNGEIYWIDVPLRLTASGHEFIEVMKKVEIWEIIKKDFKESSIKTIFKVATDLAQGYAKQKVTKLLNEQI